ncbi:Nucleic acid-binding, OB-fold [Sesbania bispinosa]|nr:Nucleic acid-binding, OB-fold [Sesbania bispinosa]
MSRKVNLVDEIDHTKQSWKLAIRVTNVWPSENYVDIIFMDEKGGKIQASLKEADLRKMNVVLEEGYTYNIKNLEVKENTGEYKLSKPPLQGTHEGGPIIMLLSLAKIKQANGNYPVTVQNTKVHSRLYINEDIDEINKFKSSLDSTHVYESYSQRLTQLSASSHVTQGEIFVQDADVMSLAEINDTNKEIFCLTVGKIDMIYDGNGWQYGACVKCSKKIDSEIEPFICARCGKTNSKRVPRILDPMEIPGPLDSILGKVLAFKIKIQTKYKAYSVHQISEDPQIIESITESIKNVEDAKKNEKGKAICSGVKHVDA